MPRSRTVVQPARLRDQIYRLVRDEVARGALAPGESLSEAGLARRYGVSRTPVREALVQLSREGLLLETPGGYAAPPASPEAIAEARELSALVGGALAGRAARAGRPWDRRALAEALRAAEAAHEANRVAAFLTACGRFESLLRSLGGNTPLAQVSALLQDPAGPALHKARRCGDYRAALLRHYRRLNAAVQDGDAAGAEREAGRFALEALCRPEQRQACPFLDAPLADAICGELAESR